jgi:hypothetical protein
MGAHTIAGASAWRSSGAELWPTIAGGMMQGRGKECKSLQELASARGSGTGEASVTSIRTFRAGSLQKLMHHLPICVGIFERCGRSPLPGRFDWSAHGGRAAAGPQEVRASGGKEATLVLTWAWRAPGAPGRLPLSLMP